MPKYETLYYIVIIDIILSFYIAGTPAVAPPPPSVDINKLRQTITEVMRTGIF